MARAKRQKSPGGASSRGAGKTAAWEVRRAGTRGMEIRSIKQELSATRGAQVYKDDPELYAKEDPYPPERRGPIPRKGTPEREELEAVVGVRIARGETQLNIATDLNISTFVVGTIVKENGFVGPRSRNRKKES